MPNQISKIYIANEDFQPHWANFIKRFNKGNKSSKDDDQDFGLMRITTNIQTGMELTLISYNPEINFVILQENHRIILQCLWNDFIIREMYPLDSPIINCFFEGNDQIESSENDWYIIKKSVLHYLYSSPAVFLFPVTITY